MRGALSKFFLYLLLRFAGNKYVLFFNLRSLFYGFTIRCKKQDSHYVFHDLPMWIDFNRMLVWTNSFTSLSTKWYVKGLTYRADYLASKYLIDFLPVKAEVGKKLVIIDVGANSGDFLLAPLSKGISVDHYIGIEPHPTSFVDLNRNMRTLFGDDLTQFSLFNVAASSRSQIGSLFLSPVWADTSIIRPLSESSEVKASMSSLDDLLSEVLSRLEVRDPKLSVFLKLEAEGAEIEVLQGSTQVLRSCDYISADLGHERGVMQESTFIPCLEFLYCSGFRLLAFDNRKMTFLFGRVGGNATQDALNL